MPITSPRALTNGPPELPGLMAASVWINSPGARRSAAGIRTIERADDSASDGEAVAQRIAEREHRLSRTQCVESPMERWADRRHSL